MCVHLQQLYTLFRQHDLKFGGSDLVRLVCHQCGAREVCPSKLMDEYDAEHSDFANLKSNPPELFQGKVASDGNP